MVQAMFTELEKIANYRNLATAGNQAGKQALEYADSAGLGFLRRNLGWGDRAKAYRSQRAAARKAKTDSISEMKARAKELRAKANPTEQERKELLALEKAHRQNTPWHKPDFLPRDKDVVAPKPDSKETGTGLESSGMSPKMMAVLGLGTAGTVGLGIAGKRYLDSKRQQSAGY
jgi:hypothetical protein